MSKAGVVEGGRKARKLKRTPCRGSSFYIPSIERGGGIGVVEGPTHPATQIRRVRAV